MTKLICALLGASALIYLIDHQAGAIAAFGAILAFFVVTVFRGTSERRS